jgi:hypothetical protein
MRIRYKTATLISSVTVRTRKGMLRIKNMPPAAALLNDIAEALNQKMPFAYCGESDGGFATRFFETASQKGGQASSIATPYSTCRRASAAGAATH